MSAAPADDPGTSAGRERSVRVDGTGIRVVERGPETAADPPLLLLHGFTGSVEAWGEALLGALASERRVLAVDLPGHGGSGLPEREGGLSLPAVVDLLTGVLDRVGVHRAVWVGYSMGGRIALGAAVLRPRRVAALVLESASPGLATEEERIRRRALDEARAAALEEDGLEAWVDDWMALPLFWTQRRLPPEVRARERARRLDNAVEGLSRALRELGTGSQPSFWDDLGGVGVPVLLLTGELDGKFRRIADAMADRLASVRRTTVPGVGHTVHLEAPRAWSSAVRRFLAGARELPG